MSKFKHKTLKHRLTIWYISLILVPFSIFSVFTYIQSQNYMKDVQLNGLNNNLLVISNAIDNKIQLVQNISHNITYNSEVQLFLEERYDRETGSFDTYFNTVAPIIRYSLNYNQAEIFLIRIYMNNHSIPEGFGFFYHDTFVRNVDWYNKFVEEERRTGWVYLPDKKQYLFLQKIVSDTGKFLGVTEITINQSSIFNTLDNLISTHQTLTITDDQERLIFSSDKDFVESSLIVKQQAPHKQSVSVTRQINELGIATSLELTKNNIINNYQLLYTIVFIIVIALLNLVFYQVLKMTFSKIKASISAMDHSIRNGFKVSVPIERNDEIGVISQKFNMLLEQINLLINEKVKRETMLKDTQLKALQAQINPHFIYNTINLFSAKTELAGLYDISDAIADFGEMIRYNLNSNKSEFTSIQQEIAHIEHYIGLQKLRYGDRINFQYECNPIQLSKHILRFILQPIVENSIVHGMSSHEEPLCITLKVEEDAKENYMLTITDNGKGIPKERLRALINYMNKSLDSSIELEKPLSLGSGSGIGLANINERLKLFYGEIYGLDISSEENKFTAIRITIPSHSLGE